MLTITAPGFRGSFRHRGRTIGLAIAASLGLAVGAPAVQAQEAGLSLWRDASAPGFSLDALDGRRLSLESAAGSRVIVHFFATWCEPCVREMAALDALARELVGDFVVIAVDVGEPDGRVRRHFEANPVSFTVLLDRDRAVMKQWGVKALPSSFVLGPGLAPALKAEGEVDWRRKDVREALMRIRAEESGQPGQGREKQ